MDHMMRLWLLGMGILPEQIEDDAELMRELKAKDAVAAWERLQMIRWSAKLNPHPEFDTPAAKLEFLCFAAGSPQLWMR